MAMLNAVSQRHVQLPCSVAMLSSMLGVIFRSATLNYSAQLHFLDVMFGFCCEK